MTTEKIFDEALKNILSEDEILKDEPMKHHTTFRVGGPAEYYLRPKKNRWRRYSASVSHIKRNT